MKRVLAGLLVLIALSGCVDTRRATAMTNSISPDDAGERQGLIDLSRQKWRWMADRDITKLEPLFHPSARFVHMGATMDRTAEIDVIRSGQIQYKHAEISELSVELIGDTAIVYSRLRLVAVVGGNEVTNPFSVTETYVRKGGGWQLAAMSFTRLLGD